MMGMRVFGVVVMVMIVVTVVMVVVVVHIKATFAGAEIVAKRAIGHV